MANDLESTERPEEAPKDPKRATYTSVVYFHGMGSQRRYEETSRLVDRLDQYLAGQYRRGKSLGYLRHITARVEPLRPDQASKDIVGYIRTNLSGDPEAEKGVVRFYEAYWAPVMADSKSPWGVLKWLLRQPLRPWQTRRAPWRERQRLRRASLVALFESDRARSPEMDERTYTRLLSRSEEHTSELQSPC